MIIGELVVVLAKVIKVKGRYLRIEGKLFELPDKFDVELRFEHHDVLLGNRHIDQDQLYTLLAAKIDELAQKVKLRGVGMAIRSGVALHVLGIVIAKLLALLRCRHGQYHQTARVKFPGLVRRNDGIALPEVIDLSVGRIGNFVEQ